MDISLDVPQGQLFIRSFDERGIRINDDYFSDPFILSGEQLIPVWDIESIDDINEEKLQLIFAMQPEVVLIGTGATQVFLPPAIQILFLRRNIGLEVMTTQAACRTFNVLVSEWRNVVAALLP